MILSLQIAKDTYIPFTQGEIENFILLREMMPAIDGFEPSAEGGRSPWGDFIFLTDESIFLGVDIEIRQLILERLREIGFVDSTFLEDVMGQPMGELYTGRVNVAFSGSGIYMTLTDIYMTVLRQDIAHTQAMFTILYAFVCMRMTQRPGMNAPRSRGAGGNESDLNFRIDEDAARRWGTGRPPERGSLNNVEARQWYLDQTSNIPNRINTNLPLSQQARQAHGLRNQIRIDTRNAMSDRGAAEHLNRTRPNLTWEQTVQRYRDRVYSGDALYRAIIDSSQRSNVGVNCILGL